MSESRRLKTMDELGRLDVEEFKLSPKRSISLILDNVRSLHNVGSTFRTADAFRLESIYLCGITATPPHREINKAALGATESVEWKYEKDTLALVNELKERGYDVYAVEQTENSIELQDFSDKISKLVEKPKPMALVFGNEVSGVQQEVVDACLGSIEIPQYGTKHSLNISVSVGIVLWELVRGRGIK